MTVTPRQALLGELVELLGELRDDEIQTLRDYAHGWASQRAGGGGSFAAPDQGSYGGVVATQPPMGNQVHHDPAHHANLVRNFVAANGLDERTEQALMALDPRVCLEQNVMRPVKDARNPAAVVMIRIRNAEGPRSAGDGGARPPPPGPAPMLAPAHAPLPVAPAAKRPRMPLPALSHAPPPQLAPPHEQYAAQGGWGHAGGNPAGGSPVDNAIADFCAQHGLDARSANALRTLTPEQAQHCMHPIKDARNPNAVIMRRVGDVSKPGWTPG